MKLSIKTLLLISTLFTYSCKKDNKSDLVKVTVIDRGSLVLEGCGWWLKLEDGTEYYPNNLSNEFKVDNLQLNVKISRIKQQYGCNIGFKATTTASEGNVIHLLKARD